MINLPISYIIGAKVRLECRHFCNGELEHRIDGCRALFPYALRFLNVGTVLVSSSLMVASAHVRHANSLSFLEDAPLSVCTDVLKQYEVA
ncbi:Pollen-specific protein C13 [Rhynchospora pubera]|uniref:Pollen-specific protein C13 n=1 Tax=Rhynchospora pubera TaxID=906938 RepID=A0AAV8D5R6_9POAL|nr:Pollen-specific protein C13 [Rhynchospora pubera]